MTATDRLLVVNLGRDLHLDPAPEPLLAPPRCASGRSLWSSEDPSTAAAARRRWMAKTNWRMPGECRVVLMPEDQVMNPLAREPGQREGGPWNDCDVAHALDGPSNRMHPNALLTSEWLVTNGLGGYASGTVGRRGSRAAITAC